jgi:putative addiction module component (TIGR02574 family)
MAVSREKLFPDVIQLEQHDRAELAKLLIVSLDSAIEQDVDEAWAREIDRRMAEFDAGTAETIPWETVRARLRASRG